MHLDVHVQNLLTDGRAITAVLDWTNAGGGDARLGAARTHALFAAARVLAPDAGAAGALERVAAGWRAGYEGAMGRQEGMDACVAWAAARTVRDLRRKIGAAALGRIGRQAARPWSTASRLGDRRPGPRSRAHGTLVPHAIVNETAKGGRRCGSVCLEREPWGRP